MSMPVRQRFVPDMIDVLPEAYDLFGSRDVTFANAVRLLGTVNPAFFKGTVVGKQAADVLASA